MSAYDADLALQKAIYARLSSDEALAALVAARIYDNVPGDVGFSLHDARRGTGE